MESDAQEFLPGDAVAGGTYSWDNSWSATQYQFGTAKLISFTTSL
jgi:hypothetical protein